jgi:sterol desaturase/sphingolipid hydroxylase (fatty acid hydroxylase superfamily)
MNHKSQYEEIWAALGVIVFNWIYAFYLERIYQIQYQREQKKYYQSILQQQILQIVGFLLLTDRSSAGVIDHNELTLLTRDEVAPFVTPESVAWGLGQFLLAMLIMDTWQYWMHRCFHVFPSLYKIHSVHHELTNPFPTAAFYNHFVESIVLDTTGFVLAAGLTHMNLYIRTAFALFSSCKNIHDHLGSVAFQSPSNRWWLDPFCLWRLVSANDERYHYVHHQVQGRKFNFQQPFFTFWDDLCDTRFQV